MNLTMTQPKDVYFFCCIGGDLLISAGISKILKELDPNLNTTLLLPAHPRVFGKMHDYYIFFDQVIELPFCSFNINPLKTVPKVLEFKKSLSHIPFPDKSLFFIFDVYELADLIFYNTIYKLKDGKGFKISLITAFDNDEVSPKNRDIVIGGTILKSMYSLLFTKTLFYEFKTKQSNFAGINYYKTRCDLQICINDSKFHSFPLKIEKNISYPPNIFLEETVNVGPFLKIFKEEVIIFLVDSFAAATSTNYWEITNEIILHLSVLGYQIYAKDHPSAPKSNLKQGIGNIKVRFLDSNLNLEEIFIGNKENIKAVLGYGSTALITASWLGIQAINLSELYMFSEILKKRFKNFMDLGSGILTPQVLADVDDLEKMLKADNLISNKNLTIEWARIMSRLN